MVINDISVYSEGARGLASVALPVTIRFNDGTIVKYDRKFIISALSTHVNDEKANEIAEVVEQRLVLSKNIEGETSSNVVISETEMNEQVHHELYGRGIVKTKLAKEYTKKNTKLDFFTRHLPVVQRSDGTTELFLPIRIMTSLLTETSIPEEMASKVTGEVVIRLLNSNQKVVTAPFIREQVCDVLYGVNPTWRFEYTRMGVPFRDLDLLCGSFLKKFESMMDINESEVERLLTEIDNAKIVQIVLRVFRDYIGTRNKINDNAGSIAIPE